MSTWASRCARHRSITFVVACAFILAPLTSIVGCTQADKRNFNEAAAVVVEVAAAIIVAGVYIALIVCAQAAGGGSLSGLHPPQSVTTYRCPTPWD